MKALNQFITYCYECPLREYSNHFDMFFCSIVDRRIENQNDKAPSFCPLLAKQYTLQASESLKSHHKQLEVTTITVSLEPPKPTVEDDDVLI